MYDQHVMAGRIRAVIQGASHDLQDLGVENVSILVKDYDLQVPHRYGYCWDEEGQCFLHDPLLR